MNPIWPEQQIIRFLESRDGIASWSALQDDLVPYPELDWFQTEFKNALSHLIAQGIVRYHGCITLAEVEIFYELNPLYRLAAL